MKFKFTLAFFALVFCVSTMHSQIIWGGPGDPNGEFDGGLNDWTATGVSSSVADSAANALWVWDADGIASEGLFAGGNTAMESPSVGNGVALFNSDFLDNGGIDFGAGNAPSPQIGELISPIIDCSGRESVTVTFYQDYRDFSNTNAYLDVSNDGGNTFTSFEVNDFAEVNQGIPFRNTFYRVNITDVAANQDSVVIKFVFNGDYYFWSIDDVAVMETPAVDLGLDDMYYAPQYASTPISQLDAIDHEFAVDVFNLGSEDQYDVKLVASIFDDADNTVFTDTVVIDTLFTRDTLFYIFDTIVNANESAYNSVGEYTLIYDLLPGDTDLATRDDRVGEFFNITEDIYSFDNGQAQNANVGAFSVGNVFKTGDWGEAGNGSFVATKIYPGEGTGSGTITGAVYKVNADIEDDFSNFDVTGDLSVIGAHPSMVPIGYFIHSVEASGIQSVDLLDIDTDEPGITLEANTKYLYLYSVEEGMRVQYDRSIDYFQVTSVVYVPGDQLYTGGFGSSYGLVAGVELGFVSSNEEIELPSSVLDVYPNPASTDYTVKLDFAESTDVTVLLTSLDGKIVRLENIKNVTNLNKTYDAQNIASGTYILRVLTDKGIRNQKLVIQN